MMQLYIHVPFCRRICSYCDFYHTSCLKNYSDFIEKIKTDINLCDNEKLETIYFGGGTPSILRADDLLDIYNCIKEKFDISSVKEITFECNPDDITEEYCQSLKDIGINRLSMGIQSFNDRHLKIMNRRHNSKVALNAVDIALRTGFKNITADLIYGLPFMTKAEWQHNLDIITGLGLQHISAYHLTIEKGTIFDRQKLQPVSDDISQLHYDMLRESLGKVGYIQYEISNFSKAGYESIHNSGYWEGKPYIGLGPSAHSFDGKNHRWWQPSNINYWLKNQNIEEEFLTKEQRNEEIIMTSLRTVKGLQTNDPDIINKAQKFIDDGYMEYENGWLKIVAKHFLISDYIISDLF